MRYTIFNSLIIAFVLLFHSHACNAQEISNIKVTAYGNEQTTSMRTYYSEPIYTTADKMPELP